MNSLRQSNVSPAVAFGIEIRHLWGILPPFLLAVISFGNQLRLLDFWWHLKAGQVIVETRSIPHTDLFSFTATGQPYILQNWLAEVLYYLLYQLGGLALIRTVNSACLAAALIVILHLCWDSVRNIRKCVVATLLLLIPLAVYSSTRPQVFSFLFFAAFYHTLDRFCRGSKDHLWILPLLMLLWVNLHGAFVLGLGLIVIYGCSLLADRRRAAVSETHVQNPPGSKRLWVAGALCVLATLVNPEGPKVYSYILRVLSDPGSQRFVTEWQPPQISDPAGLLAFYGPFFLSLLLLLYSRRLSFLEFALFFSFAAFGLTALRNGIWFALILPPIVGRRLETRLLMDEASTSRRTPRGHAILNLFFLLLLVVTLVTVSPFVYPRLGADSQWEPATPVGVVDFIESRKLSGNIFHPQIYGDYLIWRLWPNQRSFIDGRVHLFGEEIIRDYFEVFVDSCWQDRLKPYNIRYLLLDRRERQSSRLIETAGASASWRLIYQDERSILFEKSNQISGSE